MLNKKRFTLTITIVGMLIALCFVALFIEVVELINFSETNEVKIFSDISECNALDKIKVEDKSLRDEYISNLTFGKSYAYKVSYDSKMFEIYAYEFYNISDAKEYYSRVWGHTSEDTFDFNFSGSVFQAQFIARKGSNVYRIEANSMSDYVDIMQYLNNIFTTTIHE